MESEPGDEQVAALRQVIELKDEEMQQKDEEMAANRDELAANRAEIASLKAQLQKQTQPDEGLPPV